MTFGIAMLFVFVSVPRSANASSETFCKDLPRIEQAIQEKKQQSIEKLRVLQDKHAEVFNADKDRIATLMNSYKTMRVSPEFTESKKRQELQKVASLEEKRSATQAYFLEHKVLIDETLQKVESLEREAFESAYSACKDGTASALVAEAFKADMAEIRSTIAERGEFLKAKKVDTLGTTIKSEKRTPRTFRSFFTNSHSE